MRFIWYFGSAMMVVNGLLMAFALHRYLQGIMFVAIGVGFVALRQYRLRRDRRREHDRTFD